MHNSITLKTSRVRTYVLFLLAVLFLACLPLSAAAQRHERVVDTWRPLHYDVAISFNDQLTEISSARAEITLEVLAANLTKIDLDFGEMPIDSVSVSGSPVRFEREPDLLQVMLGRAARRGDKLNLSVNYHGRPQDGLIFANDRDGKPSATGDNWPNRVHQWIPCLIIHRQRLRFRSLSMRIRAKSSSPTEGW